MEKYRYETDKLLMRVVREPDLKEAVDSLTVDEKQIFMNALPAPEILADFDTILDAI